MSHRPIRRVLLHGASTAAISVALWVAAASGPAAQVPAASSSCDIRTDDRVVAVGDVHGAYDRFVAILREAKLIDGRRRWIGGRATLVQLGDILDRGGESRQVLDLLRRLAGDAARAGGQVHVLLGNHEAMRMMGDLRYVSAREYAVFNSPEGHSLRDRYYTLAAADALKRARAAGDSFDDGAFRKKFYEETPLGFVEMQMAFSDKGDYGRWLRDRDTMVRINGIVFVHGGTAPAVAALGCEAINARVRAELGTVSLGDPGVDETLVAGPNGPLWFRGLADDATLVSPAEVEAILKALTARAVVVGHTGAPDFKITSRFGGRVVQVDTGMLGGTFYPGGVASALEIQGGAWTAIYEGRREPVRPSVPQG